MPIRKFAILQMAKKQQLLSATIPVQVSKNDLEATRDHCQL